MMPSRDSQGGQIIRGHHRAVVGTCPRPHRRLPSPHALTLSLCPAIGLFASMATVLLGGIRASRLLFQRLLWDVARSPIGFFEQTPVGNLLARFSKETDIVDVDIPDKFRSLLVYAFGLLEVSLVVTVATPAAVLVLLPLLLLYAGFQVQRGWGGSWGQRRSPQPVPCLWAGQYKRRRHHSLAPVLISVLPMFTSKFLISDILSCACGKQLPRHSPIIWKPRRQCKLSKTVMLG